MLVLVLVLVEEEGTGLLEVAPAERRPLSANPRTWPIRGSERDTRAGWGIRYDYDHQPTAAHSQNYSRDAKWKL